MAERRRTSRLQVAPFCLGGLACGGRGRSGSCASPEPDLPDVVYLEQLTSALYLDKRGRRGRYLAVMEQLCVEALSPRETRDALVALRDDLRG